MSIPESQRLGQNQHQFIGVLKTATLESQGSQLLPPGFDEIEPAGVGRDKEQLDFRPGSQGQFDLSALMGAQVILDNQPAVGWELPDNLLQQLKVTGAVAAGADENRSLTRGRLID